MISRRIARFFLSLALGGVAGLLNRPQVAESQPFVPWNNQQRPTTSQAESLPPPVLSPKLSLQMRISNGDAPIIKGKAHKVTIRYQDLLGEGNHCEEVFKPVIIKDSVLNLEIGAYSNCDFQAVLAKKNELKLQVCLSPEESLTSTENVPEPTCFEEHIRVGSVPAAIRVRQAGEAETTHRANFAYQSHYSYRVAAGRASLRESPPTLPAHFSFRSGALTSGPLSEGNRETLRIAEGTSQLEQQAIDQSGFLRWVSSSTEEDARHLYFSLLNSGSAGALDAFVFGAHSLILFGPSSSVTSVSDDSQIAPDQATTSLVVDGNLDVNGDSEVSRGQLFANQELVIDSGLSVRNGGALIYGSAQAKVTQVSELIRSGWRREGLSSGRPNDTITVGGAITVVDQLSLSLLDGETDGDQAADLKVMGDTNIGGDSSLIVQPLSGQDIATEDGDDIIVSEDASILGALTLGQGDLKVSGQLRLDQDLVTSSSLYLTDQIALAGAGQLPQMIVSLNERADEVSELGLNINVTQDGAEHAYDIIRFKGDVTFHDRVDFDAPISGTPSDCVISPAHITAQDVKDDDDADANFIGKRIPDVYEVQCGEGPPIRVSMLRDSVCGNGIREGSEICDQGDLNISEAVTFYCDSDLTPFPNCQIFRRILTDNVCDNYDTVCIPEEEEGPLNGCNSTINIDPATNSDTCAEGCLPFDVASHQGECMLQNDRDLEQRIMDLCVTTENDTLNIKLVNAQGACDGAEPQRFELRSPKATCRRDCTYARCGDGILDATLEKCDDGNLVDTDDCSNTCALNSSCRLDVLARVSQSAVVAAELTESANPNSSADYSPSECLQSDGSVVSQNINENNAVQRVVELDLSLGTWVSVETFMPGLESDIGDDPRINDTHLYIREQCGQVQTAICNDNTSRNLLATIEPVFLSGPENGEDEKRYYVVVSGHDNLEGTTNVAIKFTCAEQERLVERLVHRKYQGRQEQNFVINTAVSGRRGHVQLECLDTIPEGFIQPLDPNFDSANASSDLGQHQAVVELILEDEQYVDITANSESMDPVLYVKRGCEAQSVVRLVDTEQTLLCNDNATGNPRFPMARVSGVFPAGVYYVVVDSATAAGEVTLAVTITSP